MPYAPPQSNPPPTHNHPHPHPPANNPHPNPVPQNLAVRSARAAGKAPSTGPPPQSNPPAHNHNHAHPHPPATTTNSNPKSSSSAAGGSAKLAKPIPPAKIWSTSSTEERERIKEFWLGLGEQERRSLVKIEKENVLKKMKDQQKHSCGCAVCGRKRTAIEEELEVLYDAYYDELEQYANHQQQYAASGGTIPPPAGPGPFPGSVELDRNGALIRPDHLAPQPKPHSGVPIHQQPGKWAKRSDPNHPDDEEEEEEEEEEEYSDDGQEEEEELEDEEADDEDEHDDLRQRKPVKPMPQPKAGHVDQQDQGDPSDFFRFGGPLTTVKGTSSSLGAELCGSRNG